MTVQGAGGIHQLSALLTRGGEQAKRAQKIVKLDKRKESIEEAKKYLSSAQKALENLGGYLHEDKLNEFAAKVLALEAGITTAEAQGEHVKGSIVETIQYHGGRFFAQITGDKETLKLYDALGDADNYLEQLENYLKYHRNEYLFDERSVKFLNENHEGLFRLENELNKVHFAPPLAARKDLLLARISGLKSYVETALLLNKTKGEIDLEGLTEKKALELGELKKGIINLREVAQTTTNESVKTLQRARLDQLDRKIDKAFGKKWKSLLPLERKFLTKNSSEGLSHLAKDPHFHELVDVLVTNIFHFVSDEHREHALWQLGHLMAKAKGGEAEGVSLPPNITASSSFIEGKRQGWIDLIQKAGDPMDREVIIRRAFSEGQKFLSLPSPPPIKNSKTFFIQLYRLTTLLETDQFPDWNVLKLQLERIAKAYPAKEKGDVEIRASFSDAFSKAILKNVEDKVAANDVEFLLKMEIELEKMKRTKKFQNLSPLFDNVLAIVRETKLSKKRVEILLQERISDVPSDTTIPAWPRWGQQAIREYLTIDNEADFNLLSPFALGELAKVMNDRSQQLSGKTIDELVEKGQKGLTETPPRDLLAGKIFGLLTVLAPNEQKVLVPLARFRKYLEGQMLPWSEILALHLQSLPQDTAFSMHFVFPAKEIEETMDRAIKMGDFFTLRQMESDLERLRIQQKLPVVRSYIEEALKTLQKKIEQNPRLSFERIRSLMDQKAPEGEKWDRYKVRDYLNLIKDGPEGEKLSKETRTEIARCLNKETAVLSPHAIEELLALAKYDKHHPPRVMVQAKAFAILSKFAPKDMKVSLARKTFREVLVNSWKEKTQPTKEQQVHIDRWFPPIAAIPSSSDSFPQVEILNRDLQMIGQINQNLEGKKKEEIKYLRAALEIASTEIVHLGSLYSFLLGLEKIKDKPPQVIEAIILIKGNIEIHELFLKGLMKDVKNFDHFEKNLKGVDFEKLLALNQDDIELGKHLSKIASTKDWVDAKGAPISLFSMRTVEMGVLNNEATLQPMLAGALIFGIPLQRAEKLQKLFQELSEKSGDQEKEIFSKISLALGSQAKAAL
jgi:uncharacterized protein YneF (UPF0154 family)